MVRDILTKRLSQLNQLISESLDAASVAAEEAADIGRKLYDDLKAVLSDDESSPESTPGDSPPSD